MARTKGSKNKHSFQVEEIAHRYDKEPFEIYMMIANGDWKALGFDAPHKISYTNAGIEFEEPHIKLSDRLEAAKHAGRYLYSAKQAIDHTSGGEAIEVFIHRYADKPKS